MQQRLAWAPQPGPQEALIKCPLPLIFFGGARGGGKTDGVLGKYAARAEDYGPYWNAVAFRKTTISFEDAVNRARQLYLPMGWGFSANNNRPVFTTPWGGRLGFGYVDRVTDADQWQGRNLTDVWIEEAGLFATPDPIDRLFATMRSAHGVPVQMILTANPGGAGQHWIAERFGLIPFPDRPIVRRVKIHQGTIDAAVIPSRIADNRILMAVDPGYIDRLHLTGGEALVKAWVEGDWSAIEGAFLDGWSTRRHVVRPFAIPERWLRFRSMDWGFAVPFSVGWWAVVDDDWPLDEAGLTLPPGCLVRYREWYGASGPNKGLRMDADLVAQGILDRQDTGEDELIRYTVVDPAMSGTQSGPSPRERLAQAGIMTRLGDNRRIGQLGALGGWDQLRARLRGEAPDRPMIVCFSTCKDSIRTLPSLQHDERRPEDLDTVGEDHAADDWRYACMSRPYIPKPPRASERPRWEAEGSTDSGIVINLGELAALPVRKQFDDL